MFIFKREGGKKFRVEEETRGSTKLEADGVFPDIGVMQLGIKMRSGGHMDCFDQILRMEITIYLFLTKRVFFLQGMLLSTCLT